MMDFLESPIQYQQFVNFLQSIIKCWSNSHVILIHSSATLFLLCCDVGNLFQESSLLQISDAHIIESQKQTAL